ncbi:MAG: hypothetical protein K2W94_08220 [Alphaproteobacteria bacterium]|nr:hypothetical protein [Alphaproteobacteria bacterium]
MLSSLRSGLNNDVEFFSLLNAADQNGRSLKSTISRTRWGTSLLHEIDPYRMVQPGDYGATPLMKMAFDRDLSDEYLNVLQSLGINTDQQDVYGNAARSLRDLWRASSNQLFTLLIESFSCHP